jgi:hypothetical protein
MRRPPASMLGDAADDAVAPPTLQASGGAPPPLAGAKKSLGDPGGPSKCVWVRVGAMRRSRTQSSDRDFLRMAIGSALDEAESFFISHIRQGERILLIWKFLTRCRLAGIPSPAARGRWCWVVSEGEGSSRP